jgi:hypothetical protein
MNEEQARYWNGDEAAHWLVHEERYERRLDAGPPTAARVSEAVQAALEPYITPDGLLLGSRAWLVTASRP